MNRNRILLAALLAVFMVSIVAVTPRGRAAAQSASCAATYDAAADFSITSNPNGSWSYGWEASLGGAFTPNADERSVYQGLDSWGGPESFDFNYPHVSFNHTGATLDYANGISQPANMLNLCPSPAGSSASFAGQPLRMDRSRWLVYSKASTHVALPQMFTCSKILPPAWCPGS